MGLSTKDLARTRDQFRANADSLAPSEAAILASLTPIVSGQSRDASLTMPHHPPGTCSENPWRTWSLLLWSCPDSLQAKLSPFPCAHGTLGA